jgi:nucleotide-binding universal stress UspA family protein
VQKILVAMDASAGSRAALEAAASLAAGLQAELQGLFVLDSELLRFSGLPAAVETGLTSARRRPVDPAAMERTLRAQAEQARAQLESTARRHRLHSTFHIGQGDVASELAKAGAGVDLIAMGVVGHMDCTGKRLGSTTRRIRAQTRCSLLLLRSGHTTGEAVVAVCDGDATAEPIVELAHDLAERRGQNLLVLLHGAETEHSDHMTSIRDRFSGSKTPLDFATVERFEDLPSVIRKHRCSLLVVGDEDPLIAGRDEELGGVGCPVLLARTDESQPA